MTVVMALAALAATAALFAGLVLMTPVPGLAPEVAQHIAATGVTNPVTAVLLDYRAYDTLLELLIVVLALLAAEPLAPRVAPRAPLAGPVVVGAIGALAPALAVLGGYVLWIGATAPGGALQAAALWAASLILLETVERGLVPRQQAWAAGLSAIGVAVFFGAGLAMVGLTGTPLDWPSELAGSIILGIEIAAAGALALGLAALFRAGTAAP